MRKIKSIILGLILGGLMAIIIHLIIKFNKDSKQFIKHSSENINRPTMINGDY